uniref:OSK domain-containing protein n=1 Tax=Neogobius melanostomus TaxID=47308 RepID=A0A8C6TFK2_9GOBI
MMAVALRHVGTTACCRDVLKMSVKTSVSSSAQPFSTRPGMLSGPGALRILASLTAALEDTAPWDPAASPRHAWCSTPRETSLDEEVVVRGATSNRRVKGPPMCLSNRYAVQEDNSHDDIASQTQAQGPLLESLTMIVDDSIVRHIRFFNAVTYCFPGATVSDILRRLPSLLESAPESRLVIHVGINNTTRQQSEITNRTDFKALFAFLRSVNLSVFISGPIPTWSRGDLRFSRLLGLNMWLHAKCIKSPALFNRDGLHPSGLGCHMLLEKLSECGADKHT